MHQYFLQGPGALFGGALFAGFGFIFALLLVWSIIWKGIALWKAARLTHKWWFIIMLIVNTAGILEILYIYVFSKMGQNQNQQK